MVYYFTSKPQLPQPRWSPSRATTPGPAEYDPRPAADVLATRSPAYSIGARLDPSRPSSSAPGPGQYSPVDPGRPEAPKYTLFPRRELPHYSDSPGPGSYCTPNTDTLRPRTPAYSLSSTFPPSHRIIPPEVSSPGPGSHNPKDIGKPSSPAFTLAPRVYAKERPIDTPGPGTYTKITVDTLSGHRTAPSFSFSKPASRRR